MDPGTEESGSSRKRSRSSSSRSPTPDPDGFPARLREAIMNRPDLIPTIEKLDEDRRLRRAHAAYMSSCLGLSPAHQAGEAAIVQETPPATVYVPGDAASVRRAPATPGAPSVSSRRSSERAGGTLSAAQKGKRLMFQDPPAVQHQALLPATLISPASPEMVYSVQGTQRGRTMERPVLEPLRLYRGRSFVKCFSAAFKGSIDVPYEFCKAALEEGGTSVILFGDVLMGFEVHVKFSDGKAMFTEGWPLFAHYERIGRGDIAVFAMLGIGSIGMRLYGRDGDHKPLSMRPEHGHELLNDFAPVNEDALAPPPAVAPLLNNLLGLEWEVGHGVAMGGEIMETLANVRHNRVITIPLYVCNITRTHVSKNPHFYFASSFSRFLRNQTPANLYMADDPYGRAAVISRPQDTDDVARIFIGWPVFIAHAPIVAGATYVVHVSEEQGVYHVSFFPIGYRAE